MQIKQIQPLSETNLLPIYLIEDKLQQNFKAINHFIAESQSNFANIKSSTSDLYDKQKKYREEVGVKIQEMQKKIIYEISMQLQGRIAVALGQGLQKATQNLQKGQKNAASVQELLQKKINKLKEDLKFEMSMQNHQYFTKQIKKYEQNIYKKINNTPQKQFSHQNKRTQQKQKAQTGKWQQQHYLIQQLQSRIVSLEDFSINVQKRFYNGMTSLKDSWKQFGSDLLQNKKVVNKKVDQIRAQLIKLKNNKEFLVLPDKVQDQFKAKISQKFSQIYQLLGVTLTKNQYDSTILRIKDQVKRHDDQFIQIRNELATNNQFFTFYADNSNEVDLKSQIDQINKKIQLQKNKNIQLFKNIQYETKVQTQSIQRIQEEIQDNKHSNENKKIIFEDVISQIKTIKQRLQNLQDFNRFGPDKMQRIHNMLDNDLSPSQRQLIDTRNKKNNILAFQMGQKEMGQQIVKLKESLVSVKQEKEQQLKQISSLKKMVKELQGKIQKLKFESEQSILSRKPWVCLSCDKQERQKQQIKRQVRIKKPQPFKGFSQQKSEKSIKMSPSAPFQQRFQVYDKLKQKYLSDAVRLPEILKQKLKQSSSSFHQ